MPGKDLILVLGYARSGTSALTRVISLCGYMLPQAVFGATELNPTGHWEPVEATRLNVDFIARLGIAADPSMRLQEEDIDDRVSEQFITGIQGFLASLPYGPVVIKQFRVNELMKYWVEAARRSEIAVKVVVATRHPQEVFESSSKNGDRNVHNPSVAEDASQGLCIEMFNCFWLKTNLLAERHSRGMPRVFVDYSNLLKDWRTEVDRISSGLGSKLRPDEAAIDGFLNPSSHRRKHSGPVIETFGYSWTTRVHAILSSAANNGPMDMESLDEIYHAYRLSARAFRLSLPRSVSKSSEQKLQEFVDSLPIWRLDRDF